ncbi:MAG: acetyl-CoA hydrolase/transferase family protein [Pseudorhodobacter sp.]
MKRRKYTDLTSEALIRELGCAREIYVSGCAAEITALPDLLGHSQAGATVTTILSPLVNTRSYADPVSGRRCRSFFLNREIKEHMRGGYVDFCPWSYSRIAQWLCDDVVMDAAVIMTSPPDDHGRVSLGIQTDFFPLFRHRTRKLIAVVNPELPYTEGPTVLPLEDFDAVFAAEQPLLTAPAGGKSDEVATAIATNVAELLPDGATIQLGLGKVSQAVAGLLLSHRDLSMVSGLVDDNVLRLDEAGAMRRDRPIITGAAIGSAGFYATLHCNPRFSFRPTDLTHASGVLAKLDRFFSVNSTLQVDLFGQINSEMVNGRLISTPGGFPDFLRGAMLNPEGRSIVTVRARGGHKTAPGIVSQFTSPAAVTGTKTDIDIVVSEFGVAEVAGLTMDARAATLIAIAAPEDRDRLQDEWDAYRITGRPLVEAGVAKAR